MTLHVRERVGPRDQRLHFEDALGDVRILVTPHPGFGRDGAEHVGVEIEGGDASVFELNGDRARCAGQDLSIALAIVSIASLPIAAIPVRHADVAGVPGSEGGCAGWGGAGVVGVPREAQAAGPMAISAARSGAARP